jgi:hypothetical protein
MPRGINIWEKVYEEEVCGKAWNYSTSLSDLGKISLYLIPDCGCSEYKAWKEMMERHHYLGSSKLFGRQLKYLINSSCLGYIGGLGFSSSAWRLEERDRLIGWEDKEREGLLNDVVCNSRFLILPWIKVKNLASHVLSLSLSRLAKDWDKRYGYKPALVETYVDPEIRSGTCYKASNWQYIGKTKGRGRNDIKHEKPVSVKDIYVYELKRGFCQGSPPVKKETDWVENEFEFVRLPNLSRKKRLLSLTRSFYGQPTESIPGACGGLEARAEVKGAYRFFGDKRIQMEALLESHYKKTVQRAEEYPVVLAVQDSSSLNYKTHPATKGLGCLSTKKGDQGIMLHDTLAFTPDGLPLGLLDVQVWSRDPKEHGKVKDRKNKCIEEKESYKWLKSFGAVEKLTEQTRGTLWVSVGDREADIYELFELAKRSRTHLLIRSIQNRITKEELNLWDLLEKEPSLGEMVVQVPKSDKRKAREAILEIRSKRVDIVKPKSRESGGDVELWALLVSERNAPSGEEPLCWKLLTTLEVANFEQAREKVEWYTARWGVEVYHRTLKSGCKVEDRQLGDVEKIKRCLAIDLVVAWRIYYLTMQGRKTPDVSCEAFLEEAEWKTLAYYKNNRPDIEVKPPTLWEAILLIAALGGFTGGKGKMPGAQVIWRGLKRLYDMAVMFSILKRIPYHSEINYALEASMVDGYG